MAEDINLSKAANMAARVYKMRLRYQAPVRTGELRKSVEVVPEITSNSVIFVDTFLQYGVYTDSGTGRYYKPNKQARWNPRPGRGRGGIKPRYWTNISDRITMDRIKRIFADEVKKQIIISFRKIKL